MIAQLSKYYIKAAMSRHSSSDSGLREPLSKGEKSLKFSYEANGMGMRRM